MKKFLVVLVLMAGFACKQVSAQEEMSPLRFVGGITMGIGIGPFAYGLVGLAFDPEEAMPIFAIGCGVLLVGCVMYAAGKSYTYAQWRIPMGSKRFATLKAMPVVAPKFNGVAITLRF